MLQRSYYNPRDRRVIFRSASEKNPVYFQKAPNAGTYAGVMRQTGAKAAVPIVCSSQARRTTSPDSAARPLTPMLLPASAKAEQPRKTISRAVIPARDPAPPAASFASNPEKTESALQGAEAVLRGEEAENAQLARMLAQAMARSNRTEGRAFSAPEANGSPQCQSASRSDCNNCQDRDSRDDRFGCGDCGEFAADAGCSGLFDGIRYDYCVDPHGEGLLYYQKFWYLSDVEISVRGELLCGTTLEFHENTLRLINDTHSYYIPLAQIDYIKTSDGLQTSFIDGRFGPIEPVRVCTVEACKKRKGRGPGRPKPAPKDETESTES